MKLTISPTGAFHKVNGQTCREWRGVSDKGADVVVFTAMVGCSLKATPEQQAEFDRELIEVQTDRQLVQFDYRLIDH